MQTVSDTYTRRKAFLAKYCSDHISCRYALKGTGRGAMAAQDDLRMRLSVLLSAGGGGEHTQPTVIHWTKELQVNAFC